MDKIQEITTEIACAGTGETKRVRVLQSGGPALPAGWKRLQDQVYSPKAWRERYVLRSICVPVASVPNDVNSPDANREAWRELRTALQTSWRQATQLSNWLMVELAKYDSAPLEDSEAGPRLPKMPQLNSFLRERYQEGRKRWPELDSQSFSSLRQRVVSKYLQTRFELRCRGSVSLPTFRYPVPLPIPAKDAKFEIHDEQVVLQVRVSGSRFRLRLKGGKEFRRQIATLRRVVANELLHGELTLQERRSAQSYSSEDRRHTRLMTSVAVWVPKQAPSKGRSKCVVSTGPDQLWSVQVDGKDEPWNLNQDQIRRRSVAHRRQMQRLREDSRFAPRIQNRQDVEKRRRHLQKRYQNQMTDACHKAAAMLASFCRRQDVSTIEYDDHDKSWLAEFPWHMLRQFCQEKCDAAGVAFNVVTRSSKDDPSRNEQRGAK